MRGDRWRGHGVQHRPAYCTGEDCALWLHTSNHFPFEVFVSDYYSFSFFCFRVHRWVEIRSMRSATFLLLFCFSFSYLFFLCIVFSLYFFLSVCEHSSVCPPTPSLLEFSRSLAILSTLLSKKGRIRKLFFQQVLPPLYDFHGRTCRLHAGRMVMCTVVRKRWRFG